MKPARPHCPVLYAWLAVDCVCGPSESVRLWLNFIMSSLSTILIITPNNVFKFLYLHFLYSIIDMIYCCEETPDQGNSKKLFNWGLAYSFRDIVHDYHGRKHSGMAVEC